MGCVEAVIHAGGEAQRHERAVEITAHQLLIAQKIDKGVGETLGLKHRPLPHLTHLAHDAVARTYDNVRIGIDATCSLLQLAGKELLEAAKAGFPGIAEVELREKSPDRDTGTAKPG